MVLCVRCSLFFFLVLFADEKACETRVTERSDVIRRGFPMRFAQLHTSTHDFGVFFSFLCRACFVALCCLYICISPHFRYFFLQVALPGA